MWFTVIFTTCLGKTETTVDLQILKQEAELLVGGQLAKFFSLWFLSEAKHESGTFRGNRDPASVFVHSSLLTMYQTKESTRIRSGSALSILIQLQECLAHSRSLPLCSSGSVCPYLARVDHNLPSTCAEQWDERVDLKIRIIHGYFSFLVRQHCRHSPTAFHWTEKKTVTKHWAFGCSIRVEVRAGPPF